VTAGAARTLTVLGAATGSGTIGSGPRAIPGPRSLTFRFMLWLQKWCRSHHRHFPRRIGRLLLVHGPLPLVAIIVGLAVQLTTFLPQLHLPVSVWPFAGTPADAWDRYLAITDVLCWSPWAIGVMALAPYLLTLSLLWLGRSVDPTPRRKRFIEIAAFVILAASVPMYEVALEALGLAALAALAWAFLPPAINAVCRYLGFRLIPLGGR